MFMKKNPVRKKGIIKFLHLLEIVFKIVLHYMFHYEFWSHLGCRYIIDESHQPQKSSRRQDVILLFPPLHARWVTG